jgi:hypothetical protein
MRAATPPATRAAPCDPLPDEIQPLDGVSVRAEPEREPPRGRHDRDAEYVALRDLGDGMHFEQSRPRHGEVALRAGHVATPEKRASVRRRFRLLLVVRSDVGVTAQFRSRFREEQSSSSGHSLLVRGDCPLGEVWHAELIGRGARLLEEPAALG